MRNQKELKQMYAEILANEVWHNDQHMVDYCVKKAAHIVELESGDIIAIEKPSIEKNFCFGYSDSRYDTDDYDRANNMAAHARSSVDYFIEQNMKGLNSIINHLEDPQSSHQICRVRVPYSGQPDGSQLKALQWFYWNDEHAEKFPELKGADRQRVIDGYKVVKAAFEKRLQSYLKRYGLSNVRSWSYWQDA